MNKIVRIGEIKGGLIFDYFPAIVRWSEDTRTHWQTCLDTGSRDDFSIYLEVGHPGETIDFVAVAGWWFSYQNYVEFEFEDGTIKTFEAKNGEYLTEDRETFKELVEFIDDYVSNGYELCDKTSVVLDDEDDLLVV